MIIEVTNKLVHLDEVDSVNLGQSFKIWLSDVVDESKLKIIVSLY
jgi:hypothetical protein